MLTLHKMRRTSAHVVELECDVIRKFLSLQLSVVVETCLSKMLLTNLDEALGYRRTSALPVGATFYCSSADVRYKITSTDVSYKIQKWPRRELVYLQNNENGAITHM